MDTPAADGFVLRCDGHEYAAHVTTQTGGGSPTAGVPSNWWVVIDNEERRTPVRWDPDETRESVTAKLCDWVRAGAEHHEAM
ncbi:MAG TPA: hypothetical protein VK837_06905 [Longimicrobiales bacterium]|nr:hypothetical protein [Longimicrobiales bacterium]